LKTGLSSDLKAANGPISNPILICLVEILMPDPETLSRIFPLILMRRLFFQNIELASLFQNLVCWLLPLKDWRMIEFTKRDAATNDG